MANRTKRTKKKDGVFFAALAENKPVRIACAMAGYSRRSVYEWKNAFPDFAQQWDDAIDEAIEIMEAEADRRAVRGVQKPVYYQGKRCGSIQEYSDTLLMFRLKALAPDKYRERSSQELTGKDGAQLFSFADLVLLTERTAGD